jgi:hypothetical protein
MKLIETEIEHEADEDAEAEHPTPPRPERRRVYTSLVVTLSVLVTIVVVIYLLFPKRDNELLDAAFDAHENPVGFELVSPGAAELDAWTVGVLGQAPWPMIRGEVLGARSFAVLREKVALIRCRVEGTEISLLATKARDALPRTHRRSRDGLFAVSWRRGRWTLAAVGPTSSAKRWTAAVEAP